MANINKVKNGYKIERTNESDILLSDHDAFEVMMAVERQYHLEDVKFEDFFDSKGIVIPNPEKNDKDLDSDSTANIVGSDYDKIGDKIIETLKNWELLKTDVSVDTPVGKLIAYADNDPLNPSVGIMLECETGVMDLAYAEAKNRELLSPEEEDCVCLYVYGDAYDEGYTSKHTFHKNVIEDAFK